MSANPIKENMPVLARHEGVWEGMYRHYDAEGNKIDEHKARLVCRLPETGPHIYHQTNQYTWADGRTEIQEFIPSFKDGRVWFDDEKIEGWAADLDLDANNRTTVLSWIRPKEPGLYLYEMIQISDCGQKRARIWQWFKDDELFKRTLVDERKISDSWEGE